MKYSSENLQPATAGPALRRFKNISFGDVWRSMYSRGHGATRRPLVRSSALKDLHGGVGAVPSLVDVRAGVTTPNRAQHKGPGSEPVDCLKHQSYE
uniref:Uncharacterized protein n=1 Tax=Romanomermis culicivorax TaxID=13658 RepID=A0A915HW20_ROMCU